MQVISLENIMRREYIAPDFSTTWTPVEGPQYFHVSTFKWNRPPTERAGIEY